MVNHPGSHRGCPGHHGYGHGGCGCGHREYRSGIGETEAILLGLLLYVLIQQIMAMGGDDDGRQSGRALNQKGVEVSAKTRPDEHTVFLLTNNKLAK